MMASLRSKTRSARLSRWAWRPRPFGATLDAALSRATRIQAPTRLGLALGIGGRS